MIQYIIYQMVEPTVLSKVVADGYYTKTENRIALLEVSIGFDFQSRHPSMESAMLEITNKKDKLKHLTITILPVISINWEGEIN